jgi:hypothetical protein
LPDFLRLILAQGTALKNAAGVPPLDPRS